ncbi:amino acid adenylation domain-containing protein [Sorangium sp. So ce269]
MKEASDIISHLRKREIAVWIEGDSLRLRATKGALTPELKSELALRKEEILRCLREEQQARAASQDVIERVPEGGEIPLSFSQQRLWFLHQLEGPSSTYNMPLPVLLDGPLDVAALRRALDDLWQRHEVLRTRFVTEGGRPTPVVSDDPSCPVVERSLEPQADEELELARQATAEVSRPFDLEREAPIRITLLRISPTRHAILATAHHIAFDAWSSGVFLRELSALYAAHRSGQPAALPELPVRYADYAAWQRRRLSGPLLATQLEYWRKELAGVPAALELPTDRPRPRLQTFRGRSRSFALDARLTGDLERVGREAGATLFMVLLSGFAALLHRYSGQDDLAIGTPIANRTRAELEPLIGCFVNTLALRVRPGGSLTARELIAAVRRTSLDAYAHQDVPFEHLVEKLQPARDLGRNPVFQVMFILQNAPASELRLPDLELSWLKPTWTTSRMDLTLSMEAAGAELTGAIEYNTDLFDDATIERLIGHYRSLLAAIARDPGRRLEELPLLAPEERAELLSAWNRTERAFPDAPTFLSLFEAQVEAQPDAIAAEFEGESLTYRALDERANQLAWHLAALGVGPGARVAFCVDRSLAMLVGLLGVLKAGGAYVAMDPAYPSERLAFMLEDCRPALVLTEARLAPGLPPSGAPAVLIDRDWAEIAGRRADAPPRALAGAHPAYVLYTSGSTGRPKGVEVPHRALLNFLLAMRERPGLARGEALLAVTTISFDIAGLELYLPLMAGGRVVLLSQAAARDPSRLSQALQGSGATVMQATPATFRMLVAADLDLGALRRVFCGGEALPRPLSERLVERGLEVWNLYGPTETTIWSTVEPIRRREGGATAEGVEPIGRPIDNTRIYVIDRRGEPVPVGVAGELCIAGDGVANGYLGRPALTAERFVPEPFGPAPGARMYRTGDLARYRADGTLEFLGRLDQQVKVRGHRIELGEIESTLAKHPGVRECAVALREIQPDDARLTAYVVPQGGALAPEALRSWLKERLPEAMTPSLFVELPALPLTPNGKIDRKALPAPAAQRSDKGTAFVPTRTRIEQQLAEIWSELLRVDRVGIDDSFFDLGGHSLLLTQLHARLRRELDPSLALVDLFRYPTIRTLAGRLRRDDKAEAPAIAPARAAAVAGERIAVVGMAGRFPRSRDLGEFWQNLRDGVDCIEVFSEEELLAAGVPRRLLRDPRYVRARGVLDDVGSFDAGFFGFSPREAALMDPQQRIFLEVAWGALEDAGYGSSQLPFPVGVFASASQSVYYLVNLAVAPEGAGADADYLAMIGSDKDYLPTRVSYTFNLTGPSVSVQTACSSSLVAVHMACRSLLGGECDMALAGGVCVQDRIGYLYEDGMVASPDGRCRAFDARAQGTVWGSGAGVVVLKRLSDAVRDGDTIHAVILGSAINNDGARKVGFTAPSVSGQAAVIAAARAAAGVDPASITYVEAHGTGTPLGDPIELAALTEATRPATDRRGFCAIGSVKTNIGHLDAGAGVAGLLKTVLALKHREIPPTVHFERPNPKLDLESSPFFVNSRLIDWEVDGGAPRRAGVSSFGIGGTNAHVVLEEAPSPGPSAPAAVPAAAGGCCVLPLSARTEAGLSRLAASLAQHLREHPDLDLADVAFTLQVGRRPYTHRKIVICRDLAGAAAALAEPAQLPGAAQEHGDRAVAFLFPGQGSQYAGMGQDLYDAEPRFREAVDRCAEALLPLLGLDLRQVLFPPADGVAQADLDLAQTRLTQPALFTIEYALAQLWLSWGVRPEAMIGHSVGEYVAATLAGVLELPDALALVAARGRLIQSLPTGSMLAVSLAARDVESRALLGPDLSLAAINGPAQCVVSGPSEAIERLRAELAARGVESRKLRTSHAFHSSMMDPILADFAAELGKISLKPPQIPFASNVTGGWITAEQATSVDYWVRHLRDAVEFAAGLQTVMAVPDLILLEVGPGRTLGGLVRRMPVEGQRPLVLASLPGRSDQRARPGHPGSEPHFLASSLGRLWLSGAKVDWSSRPSEGRRRLPLPTYPFERQRYWIDKPAVRPGAERRTAGAQKILELEDWFYLPAWKPSLAPRPLGPDALRAEAHRWLLLADGSGLSRGLAALLEQAGQEVFTAVPGASFSRRGDREFTLRPASPDDHLRLLDALGDRAPDRILHLWSCSPGAAAEPGPALFEACQETGFYSLLALTQALSSSGRGASCRLSVIADRLFDPLGGDRVCAEKAPLLALAHVIPQENPSLLCQSIEIELPGEGSRDEADLAGALLAEISRDALEPSVAYRGRQRLVPSYEPVRLQEGDPEVRELRPGGVYLITGGLGRIGLCLARHLARTVKARLALVARSFPERSRWDNLLAERGAADLTSLKIRALQEIEALGGEVLVLEADVADERAMRAALEAVEARFGALHGVVHAAGARGDGTFMVPLAQADRAACEAQFRPKVHGTYVLDALLRDRELDFCVLLSSTSAILGGLGLGPYAAANRFMDAFVQMRGRAHRGAWLAMNWDAWTFDEAPGAAELAMTPDEGAEAFDRALRRAGASQVVVAVGALEARIGQWLRRREAEPGEAPGADRARHPRPAMSTPFVAPRTELEGRLAEIFGALLGFASVGVQDDFFDLGGDSLLAVRLAATIHAQLGKPLSPALLLQAPTVARLAEHLEAPARPAAASPVVPIQPRGDERPLFFVPGTGGHVLYFHALATLLEPSGHPFYGLQAIGLDGIEPPRASVAEIAAGYIEPLRAVQPHGPYHLGGHSFGSWVAYELAQQLMDLGEEVALLTVLDTVAPSERDLAAYQAWTGPDWILAVADIVGQLWSRSFALSRDALARLSWDEQLDRLSEAFQSAGVIPAGTERRHIQGLVEVYRTQAQMDYRRPPGRPVPISLFRATELNPGAEEIPEARRADPTWGWGPYARGEVSLELIPGDHLTIMSHPHVRVLAENLRRHLASRR